METGDDVLAEDVMRFIVETSGMSARQISLAMGMNGRYVSETLNRGKDVRTSTLVKTCEDGTADAPRPIHVYLEADGVFHHVVP